jgi:hypothetical protein
VSHLLLAYIEHVASNTTMFDSTTHSKGMIIIIREEKEKHFLSSLLGIIKLIDSIGTQCWK